jgi:hypothetical protein
VVNGHTINYFNSFKFAEVNEIVNSKTEKISETTIWFFEKINKTDKPLAKSTKKKRQITSIRTEQEIPLQTL